MTETNVFQLSQPGTFADPLSEVLRMGRESCWRTPEAEVAAFLASSADKLTSNGRLRLVRHEHLPEREIMTASAQWRCAVRARLNCLAWA